MTADELMALAKRIEATYVVSLAEQRKKPGPVWFLPLSDEEQAAVVEALRTLAAELV